MLTRFPFVFSLNQRWPEAFGRPGQPNNLAGPSEILRACVHIADKLRRNSFACVNQIFRVFQPRLIFRYGLAPRAAARLARPLDRRRLQTFCVRGWRPNVTTIVACYVLVSFNIGL